MTENVCISVREMHIARRKNDFSFTVRVPALEIEQGRILAVLGRSGCGKSTLLDALALILRPEKADRFRFNAGRELDLMTASRAQLARLRRLEMGYVLQSGGLLSFITVRDNILLPARLAGHGHSVDSDFHYLVNKLGIADQLDKKPQHLSGGQRQRVAIARALLHRPRLILADEPTAAVDYQMAKDICQTFRELARERNIAVVVVSHDIGLMQSFADRGITFRLERRSENDVVSTMVECRER